MKILKSNQRGFSLIELIIAIAVLAVLSIPLLSYFLNASENTSKGNFIQEAEMAAQSIIEDINSYNTYEQFTNAMADGTCPLYVIAPESGKQKYLARDIFVNGKNLQSRVTLDFDYSSDGSDMMYNDYEMPDLEALYSSKNAVAVEKDQTEIAVSEFLHKYPTRTKAQIQAGIVRNIKISLEKNPLDSMLVNIHVYYEYTYNGETYAAPSLLKTQYLTSEFSCIYLLYDLYRGDVITEQMEVDVIGFSTTEASSLKCYFICQNSMSELAMPIGYKINATGSGQYLHATYFTNGISTNLPKTDISYVTKEQKERIANITVDIYNENEVSFTASTRILRLQSAKGE